MFFDARLKRKAEMKDLNSFGDENGWKRMLIRIIKISLTVMYCLICPLMMAGDWCMEDLEDDRGRLHFGMFLPCRDVAK